MKITTIDCRSPQWVQRAEAVLRLNGQAGVTNFDLTKHAASCALLAKGSGLDFSYRDCVGQFRKSVTYNRQTTS